MNLNNHRLNLFYLLTIMSLFCFTLSVFRFYITDSKLFLFLNWNLFLAFIPWSICTLIFVNKRLQNQKVILFGLLISWLLFFPNSVYILTDLFHLKSRHPVPIWYDLVLILAFAWTGLMYGFLSLSDIETFIEKWTGRKIAVCITVLLLFIGSFGVYLGRFLRWNTWDIVSNPSGLFFDINDRIINPTDHPRTWAITILFGLLLNFMYWSVRAFKKSAL
jgi:uncharacterized membrane protein